MVDISSSQRRSPSRATEPLEHCRQWNPSAFAHNDLAGYRPKPLRGRVGSCTYPSLGSAATLQLDSEHFVDSLNYPDIKLPAASRSLRNPHERHTSSEDTRKVLTVSVITAMLANAYQGGSPCAYTQRPVQ